jgi:hypothetical protein
MRSVNITTGTLPNFSIDVFFHSNVINTYSIAPQTRHLTLGVGH